jgi:PIN domain nuclease of toxin-antitoxin system
LKILLDTHILLWALRDSDKLKPEWKEIISDYNNTVFVSVISIWESIIKADLGKLDIKTPYYKTLTDGIKRTGFEFLELNSFHFERLETLEKIHKDPFDRILICQALSQNLTLLTDDLLILQYPHSNIFINSKTKEQ